MHSSRKWSRRAKFMLWIYHHCNVVRWRGCENKIFPRRNLLKLMDYIHWFKHHQCVAPMGKFEVPHDGFGCDHEKFIYVKMYCLCLKIPMGKLEVPHDRFECDHEKFTYVKRYCLCLKIIYPWVGCRNISKSIYNVWS